MENFVNQNSVVREIWGKSDTILFIFAGASAEFALNKAVDWLFYTGKLPRDPLGRLFSTVTYAREIVFASYSQAIRAIKNINAIHASIEKSRGKAIPDWAYRDVLFMLIDYSIRSYEVLERPLTKAEKKEVFEVFTRVGEKMKLKDLPTTFDQYEIMRKKHLEQDLRFGEFSHQLYKQYRKNLGWLRYRLLIETQALICPGQVRKMLPFKSFSIVRPLLFFYKTLRKFSLDGLLKSALLPSEYKQQIKSMDHSPIS
ncbi:oxygenase MpaB family protein [Salegentibacter sp. HM20]